MAPAIHQIQGSNGSFFSVSSFWNRGSRLHQFVPSFLSVEQRDMVVSLKCEPCMSKRAFLALGSKTKIFKISAFRGNSNQDDNGDNTSGSRSLNNPVQISYLQNEIRESSAESSKVLDVVSSPCTFDEKTSTQSIQNLFKNWLMLLRMPSQSQQVECFVEKPSIEKAEMKNIKQKEGAGISNAVFCYFKGLDATVTIPFLIFPPLYLAVNLIHGSEISKELTPLWIAGPLILSLYIKLFRALGSLYVFTFKQTLRVSKNLPACYLVAYKYIFSGKLKRAIQMCLVKPLLSFKKLDAKIILKYLKTWLLEMYLDFVESIWPYYCRTIRFLKRANLI